MNGNQKIPAKHDPRFEALLSDAARDLAAVQEQEADQLFEQLAAEGFEPSARHLADMEALLQEAQKPQRRRSIGKILLQWAACLILAVCIGGVFFPTHVTAVWQRLRSFVYQRHVTHTEIHVSAPESDGVPIPSVEEFVPVRPAYIPTGFVCTDNRDLKLMSLAVYERDGQRLHFQQMFADGSGISLDTENAYTEHVQINRMEALYVEKQVEDSVYRTVLYHDEVYIYLLFANNLSREELFKVARSIPV